MFNIDSALNEIQKASWGKFRGGEFLIAPTSSLPFQRTFSRLQAPHRKKIEKGTLDPQISQEISCQALSEAIILDWKGIQDGTGADVPFSKEKAYQLLMKMPDFREYVQEFSMDLENFRKEETQEMGKQ